MLEEYFLYLEYLLHLLSPYISGRITTSKINPKIEIDRIQNSYDPGYNYKQK